MEDPAHEEINRSIYEGDVGRCNLNATQFSVYTCVHYGAPEILPLGTCGKTSHARCIAAGVEDHAEEHPSYSHASFNLSHRDYTTLCVRG